MWLIRVDRKIYIYIVIGIFFNYVSFIKKLYIFIVIDIIKIEVEKLYLINSRLKWRIIINGLIIGKIIELLSRV